MKRAGLILLAIVAFAAVASASVDVDDVKHGGRRMLSTPAQLPYPMATAGAVAVAPTPQSSDTAKPADWGPDSWSWWGGGGGGSWRNWGNNGGGWRDRWGNLLQTQGTAPVSTAAVAEPQATATAEPQATAAAPEQTKP